MSNNNDYQAFLVRNFNFNDEDDFNSWLDATIAEDIRLEQLDAQAAASEEPEDEEATEDEEEPEDDEDYSSDSDLESTVTASSGIHAPSSERGRVYLHRICTAFFLDPATPFATLRAFFERNLSILAHLDRLTVANPNHYVTYGAGEAGGLVAEPVLMGERNRAATHIITDIGSVEWGSAAIDSVIRDPDQDGAYKRDVLRKDRRGAQRSRRARAWLRKHDPTFAEEEAKREAAKRKQRNRPRRGSILRKEVRMNDSDN